MEISNGRFKLGVHQKQYTDPDSKQNVTKDVEVWKTIIHNSKDGRSLSLGNNHIWPSVILDNSRNDTFIYYSLAKSDGGHYQGDFDQWMNGVLPNADTANDIDPAGGFGQLRFISKESSLWHAVSVKLCITETQKVENGAPKDNEVLQFDATKTKKKYDANGLKDLEYEYNGNEDYTIVELEDEREIKDNTLIRYFKVSKKSTSNNPLNYFDDDFLLDYVIGPNNNSELSTCKVEIVGVYMFQKGTEYYQGLESNPILLANYSQGPNCMWYCCMAWVNKPKSVEEDPVPIESSSISYNTQYINLYLYVEFGVSPNGGHDIYWNQKIRDDLDGVLPSTIANNITISTLQNGNKDWTNKYTTFNVVNMKKDDGTISNYFTVSGASNINNNDNNNPEDRSQKYQIENLSIAAPTTIEVNNIKYDAANADYTDNIQTVEAGFYVNRYTTTSPWEIKINAELHYKKFNGYTNGQNVVKG